MRRQKLAFVLLPVLLLSASGAAAQVQAPVESLDTVEREVQAAQDALARAIAEFDGPQQCAGLVARLLVLRRRVRIGHDARARLDAGPPPLDDNRADRDAEVEVAGEVEVAHGPRVDPAAARFE